MDIIKPKRSPEEVRKDLELRRSSAASKHANRKKYNRERAKRECQSEH